MKPLNAERQFLAFQALERAEGQYFKAKAELDWQRQRDKYSKLNHQLELFQTRSGPQKSGICLKFEVWVLKTTKKSQSWALKTMSFTDSVHFRA